MKFLLFFFSIALITFSCKRKGCTDPTALNYDYKATISDNSCIVNNLNTSKTIHIKQYSQSIYEDVTLKNIEGTDVDYIVDGFYEFRGNLTIEPGVVIKFKQESGFIFSGENFTAIGTENEKIVFTSFDSIWDGVTIFANSNIQLSYIDIINAGNSASSEYYRESSLAVILGSNNGAVGGTNSFSNINIIGSSSVGLTLDQTTSFLENFSIDNFKISKCNLPIKLHLNLIKHLDNIVFEDNLNNFISVFSFSASEAIHIKNYNLPIHIVSSYGGSNPYFDFGYPLTVDEGVTLLFDSEMKINFSSDLNFNGSSAKPIIIGGISNQAAYWRGFEIEHYNDQQVNFDHVIYQNTGINNYPNMVIKGTGNVNFTNSTMQNGGTYCGIEKYTTLNLNTTNSNFINIQNPTCN